MTTSISTKLAALALALMVNSVIMGGIAVLVQRAASGCLGRDRVGQHRQTLRERGLNKRRPALW